MNVETAWELSRLGGWPLALIAVLSVLVVVGYAFDRRAGQSGALTSAVLRLLGVVWLALFVLGLSMWRDRTQPQPGHYALLVDRTGSTAVRPVLKADLDRVAGDLGAALRELGSVERLGYGGRSEAERWQPTAATGAALGGPTHALADLDQLPLRVLKERTTRVLLTDGADRTLASPRPTTVDVDAVLLPFHTRSPSPLLLTGVESDAYALVRSPLRLTVTVRRASVQGPGQATVQVYNKGIQIGAKLVQFPPGAVSTVTEIDVLPTREGYQVFRVEVRGKGLEFRSQLHRSRIPVRVIRDRIRVLHVVGRPDWETRLLRENLKGDPTVDLVSFQILRTHGDRPGAKEDELSLIPFPTKELFTTELPKFDVVLFQNFDYQPYFQVQFRNLLLRNLRTFVLNDGGGFAMTAGDLSFGYGGYHHTPLQDVLPVQWAGRGSFAEDPAPLGDGPFADWFGAPAPDHGGWVDRVYRTDARDDARVVWQSGREPVVVVGEAGQGRSAAVLTDRLWRAAAYGNAADRAAIASFYSRLIRYLAGDPAFEDVHVRWNRLTARPGSTVEGTVTPAPEGLQAGELINSTGKPVTRVAVADGSFTARLPATDATLRLRVGGHTAPEPLIVQLPLAERTHLDVDHAGWRAWAESRDALLVDLRNWRASDLMERMQQQARRVVHRDVVPVGTLPWYWIGGLVLLLLDLTVRRIRGAP